MYQIVPMAQEHVESVLDMMRRFYDSPAVLVASPVSVFEADLKAAVSGSPYVEGYVFMEDSRPAGYALCSLSWSTEYGGVCVWTEDLYLEEAARGKGLGSRFLRYIEESHPEAVRFRLEAEENNDRAVAVYRHLGYQPSPYLQLTRERVAYPVKQIDPDKEI